MTDKIAGLWLSADTRQTIEQSVALHHKIFSSTYTPFQKKEKVVSTEVKYIENVADGLRYILHPDHIKDLVSKTETPEQLMQNALKFSAHHSIKPHQYISDRINNTTSLFKNFSNNVGNMLAAAWDTETLELVDKNGKRHSMIMEFGFVYKNIGNKQFTRDILLNSNSMHDLVSSSLIGITDQELIEAMKEIPKEIKNRNPLTEQQKLVFDFISRIGDEGTVINYDQHKPWLANIEKLTTKARGEYQTAENFERGLKKMVELGGKQMTEAADGQKYNMAQMLMVQNMAYLASNDVDLVIGKNALTFDIPRAQRDVLGIGTYYTKEYENLVGKGHLSFARDVAYKTADFDEWRRSASRSTQAAFDRIIFDGDNARLLETTGFGKQEYWMRALGWDEMVSHAAYGDALQLMQFSTDKGKAHRAMSMLINDLQKSYNKQSRMIEGMSELDDVVLQGSLFQAKTSGSMKNISKYQGYAAGIVTSSNGNMYLSNGTTWSQGRNGYFESNQFAPGLWNKGMTYQFDSAEVLEADKIKDPLIRENIRFGGEDVFHIQMSIYDIDNMGLDYTGKANQKVDLFVARSMAPQFLADNFNMVRGSTADKKVISTPFAKGYMDNVIVGSEIIGSEKGTSSMEPFRITNKQIIRDSAERSLNKFSQTTINQAIRYRDLAKNGTFASGQNPHVAIYEAIMKDLNDSSGKFEAVKAIAGTGKTAQEEAVKLAQGFLIDSEFNPNYLDNVNIIAQQMQKGSVLEQVNSIVRTTAKVIGLDIDDLRNTKAGAAAIKNMVAHLRNNAKTSLLGRSMRGEDQRSMFYIPLKGLTKARRIGAAVGEEQLLTLGVNLNNVNQTIGSMLSLAQVPENLHKDGAYARDAVLQIIREIANSDVGDLYVTGKKGRKSQLRDKINQIFIDTEKPLNRRNAADIVHQVTGYLQNIRNNSPLAGIKSTEYFEDLSSFVLKNGDIPEDLTKDIKDIAKKTLTSYKLNAADANISPKTVASDITEAITKGSTAVQYPENYSIYTTRLLETNRARNIDAARAYGTSMVEHVRRCGGQIRVTTGHQIEVMWGNNGVWQNIDERIVRLINGGPGLNYYQVGAKGTLYSTSPIARWASSKITKDPSTIRIDSALNLAVDKVNSKKNIDAMEEAIASGRLTGEEAFEKFFIQAVNKDIYRQQLAGDNVAKDFQNEMTLQLGSLFYAKDLETRLPELKKIHANNPDVLEQLAYLEEFTDKVLNKGFKAKDARQHMQNVAAMNLFTGSNTIVRLFEDQDWIKFTTDFKKSAGNLEIGMNSFANAFNPLADPGKQTATYENSASYFVKPTESKLEELAKLKVSIGPRYATQTQSEVARYIDKASGLEMTNALQVPILETNAEVKEEILNQIMNLNLNTDIANNSMRLSEDQLHHIEMGRYHYLKRARDVVAKRLNTTEGGGFYNGYLTDLIDTSWATQIIKLNGREVDFGKEFLNQRFRENTEMEFMPIYSEGYGHFKYGRGYFRGFDRTVAKFKSQYGSTEPMREFAKNPSIVTVEYMSRLNKGLLSEADVEAAVKKHLGRKTDITAEQFEEAANKLFDKVIVARSISETDYKKMLFDKEKHVGASSTAFLGNLMNEGYSLGNLYGLSESEIETELRLNPEAQETLLYRMLHTETMDKVARKSGADWRGSVALRKDVYDAIADLDFSHPIFMNIGERNQERIRNEIAAEYGKIFNLGEDLTEEQAFKYRIKAKNFFREAMTEYRKSINDPLYKATNGALVFGESAYARSKHKDVSMLVENTVDFIQEQIFKKASKDREDSIASLQEAVNIFNQFNAIKAKNQIINLELRNGIPTIIVPDDIDSINFKRIEEGISAAGYDMEDWKNVLNGMRDFRNGKLSWHMGTLQFLFDDTRSLKTLNITEREMSRFSTRMWTKDVADKIKKDLETNWQNNPFASKYLTTTDMYQRAANQQVLGEELIDYMFKESAFASFKDNAYGKEKIKGAGSSIKAAQEYNPAAVIAEDKYKAAKTKELIEKAKKFANVGDYNPYISQEFADTFYAAASTQSAARFNMYEDRIGSANAIITDWGMNKTDTSYFDLRRLDASNFSFFHKDNMQAMAKDPNSIARRNILWNMADEDIGLTADVLGKHSLVAVPGAPPIDFENMDETMKMSPNKSQLALNRVYEAKAKVATAYEANSFDDQYKKAVNEYIDSIQNLEDTIANAAVGKNESDYVNQIQRFRAPGSVSGKVNVTDTSILGPDSQDFEALLGNKTYKGKSLKELAKSGNDINYMIIGKEDLKKMGFTDDYFRKNLINRDEWMKKAQTEGIAGIGHRWPSIYWGSNMGVQVYVDKQVGEGIIRMDSITAAFMKADADGDRAQLFMLGATQKNGRWIDELSLSMVNSMDKDTKDLVTKYAFGGEIRSADQYLKGHTDLMLAQRAYYNDMIKQDTDLHKKVLTTFDKFLSKADHVDITGKEYLAYANTALNPEEAKQVSDAFLGVKDHLVTAMESTSFAKDYAQNIKQFKEAETGKEAFEMFKGILGKDKTGAFRAELWDKLGAAQEIANEAYKNAYKLVDADTAFLQRIARGGAGVIDNPFTAADLLRREGQAQGILTAKQSFAMDMVREHIQEDFLTPKQMSAENARLMKDLNRVSDLYGKIFEGSATEGTKEELVELLMRHRRETSARYQEGALMNEFLTNGKVDDRKIIREAVDAAEHLSDFMHRRAAQEVGSGGYYGNMLNTTQTMVRLAKMHTDNIMWAHRTMGSVTQNAMNEYNKTAAPIAKQIADLAGKEGKGAIDSLRGQAGIVERVIEKAGSGKWSRNAIALAGAIMFTGFVGGNPSAPSGREAEQQDNYQSENPPVSINLADPSLSASGRKQPGYVININAQTQKDKDYASQVITQAVTRNYRNTNVNVSMNVNQQPGNISGKEIADYLRAAF